MNPCVVCFSRTGNTKKFAQAIADIAKAPLYDLASAEASVVEKCDLLIFGTPVEGASPTKEAMAYIANMPPVSGKKAILFCTYRIFGNERAMKAIEKALSAKGYETILKVSKKGMKPEKEADFSRELAEIKKTLENIK
ncbi:MAG: flavodoxin domain-containing protein [Candidatus Bathyarchaeota archaeon]|nr:flavodoxin domain-containing protein [Candidatus Bathyarchaeota archaeon]